MADPRGAELDADVVSGVEIVSVELVDKGRIVATLMFYPKTGDGVVLSIEV